MILLITNFPYIDRPESKLVEAIVNDVLKKLNQISSNNDFNRPVGINKRIVEIEPL